MLSRPEFAPERDLCPGASKAWHTSWTHRHNRVHGLVLYRDTSDDPMPEPVAYLNDRFLPQSQARLALNHAGFGMGATVTDLFRTMRFRPFRLADHLQRFRASCAAARIPQTRSHAELAAIAEELIARNAPLVPADADLAVVLFATPG